MELLKLLHFLTFLLLGVVASHADLDVYWKSKLPNTPMPKAVRDLIHNGKSAGGGSVGTGVTSVAIITSQIYRAHATEEQVHNYQNSDIFFLKKNLHSSMIMKLQFVKSVNCTAAFLPRQVADSIPFSSKHVPEILNKLSVNPQSSEADIVKKSIAECEEPAIKGEDKYCATSLESMVDFATSKLGKNVQAVSTEVQKEDTKFRKYGIVDISMLNNDDKAKAVAVCHKQNYAYAVFYCHTTQNTEAYMVDLVGVDGANKAKAVAVCHKDTAEWNPKHLSFQVLKVKPGTVPICHFLPLDQIVWVPK